MSRRSEDVITEEVGDLLGTDPNRAFDQVFRPEFKEKHGEKAAELRAEFVHLHGSLVSKDKLANHFKDMGNVEVTDVMKELVKKSQWAKIEGLRGNRTEIESANLSAFLRAFPNLNEERE